MVAAQTEDLPLGLGIRAYSSRTTPGALRGGRGVPLWFSPSGSGQVPWLRVLIEGPVAEHGDENV
jgi:hypothetical protein